MVCYSNHVKIKQGLGEMLMSNINTNRNTEVLNRIYEIKDELTQIIKFAIDVAKSEKKSNRTSNYNMVVDIKDNLHEPLKSFAEEKGIQYGRSNLSQYFVIDNEKVKIKFHNSLPKIKREIIKNAESTQMVLPLECFAKERKINDSEFEIGIKTSTDRTTLQMVRVADFNNEFAETLYNHKAVILKHPIVDNIQKNDGANNQETKSNFRIKESLRQEKEQENKEERK